MKKNNKKALVEIKEFFEKAGNVFKKNKNLSNNYVRKARNLAMKHRINLPKELKRKFCKNCYSYLFPGINCRIRMKNRKVVISCFECKGFARIPYIKEIKNKRSGQGFSLQ